MLSNFACCQWSSLHDWTARPSIMWVHRRTSPLWTVLAYMLTQAPLTGVINCTDILENNVLYMIYWLENIMVGSGGMNQIPEEAEFLSAISVGTSTCGPHIICSFIGFTLWVLYCYTFLLFIAYTLLESNVLYMHKITGANTCTVYLVFIFWLRHHRCIFYLYYIHAYSYICNFLILISNLRIYILYMYKTQMGDQWCPDCHGHLSIVFICF